MPKDFNELLATDRAFIVQDKTFTWRDVSPEVLTAFDPEQVTDKNGDDPNAVWKLMDAQIMLFIDPTQHEQWKDLRAREENPVTISQINGILTWLMEEQTGRPTEAPSPSASGPGKGAASSTAGSR